jgi:hypothetical protein
MVTAASATNSKINPQNLPLTDMHTIFFLQFESAIQIVIRFRGSVPFQANARMVLSNRTLYTNSTFTTLQNCCS